MKNGNGNGKAKAKRASAAKNGDDKISKRDCIRALFKAGFKSGPIAEFLRVPQQYACSTRWLDRRPAYDGARKTAKRATREYARRGRILARAKRLEARAS